MYRLSIWDDVILWGMCEARRRAGINGLTEDSYAWDWTFAILNIWSTRKLLLIELCGGLASGVLSWLDACNPIPGRFETTGTNVILSLHYYSIKIQSIQAYFHAQQKKDLVPQPIPLLHFAYTKIDSRIGKACLPFFIFYPMVTTNLGSICEGGKINVSSNCTVNVIITYMLMVLTLLWHPEQLFAFRCPEPVLNMFQFRGRHWVKLVKDHWPVVVILSAFVSIC